MHKLLLCSQAAYSALDTETPALLSHTEHPASSHWEELRGLWKQSSMSLVLGTWYAGFWAAPLSWLVVAVSGVLNVFVCLSDVLLC